MNTVLITHKSCNGHIGVVSTTRGDCVLCKLAEANWNLDDHGKLDEIKERIERDYVPIGIENLVDIEEPEVLLADLRYLYSRLAASERAARRFAKLAGYKVKE